MSPRASQTHRRTAQAHTQPGPTALSRETSALSSLTPGKPCLVRQQASGKQRLAENSCCSSWQLCVLRTIVPLNILSQNSLGLQHSFSKWAPSLRHSRQIYPEREGCSPDQCTFSQGLPAVLKGNFNGSLRKCWAGASFAAREPPTLSSEGRGLSLGWPQALSGMKGQGGQDGPLPPPLSPVLSCLCLQTSSRWPVG